MLFKSIDAISNAKNLQDKYEFQVNEQQKHIAELMEEKFNNDISLKVNIDLRDTYRDDLKEMCQVKSRLESEKMFTILQSKNQIT